MDISVRGDRAFFRSWPRNASVRPVPVDRSGPTKGLTDGMRILGIAGWSGAGKTTLIVRVIPLLRARGLRVSTIKHAHHGFDIDIPGKDSYEHRAAGAGEVIVVSSLRLAQVQELHGAAEPELPDLVRRLAPCDLILVEGFKREAYHKLEVFRTTSGKAPRYRDDPMITAIATDAELPGVALPRAHIDDLPAIAELVTRYAEPIDAVMKRAWADGAVA